MKTQRERVKRALAFVACICFSSIAFASNPTNDETWKLLDMAKTEFSNREFGNALTLCEKARDIHEAYVDACVSELERAFVSREVKKAGDAISDVQKTLVSRNESTALEILDSILVNHPATDFGGSIANLMNWLRGKKAFPEADFLAGTIYEAEGERSIAVSYYESAWSHREYLDIPAEKYTIAYRMADISKSNGKSGDQEKYLLLVLTDEPLFGTPGVESPTLMAMMKSIESEQTTEKFFKLYRYANYVSLKACADLAELYRASNRTDREFPSAVLSAILSVTMLSSAVSARDFEYEYSGLGDLMVRAGKSREILAYAHENNAWNSLYALALALRDRGHELKANDLLGELVVSCPDDTTAKMARDELSRSR